MKMNKLLKNAKIIYNDGLKENYGAILISSNGIYIGEINNNSKNQNDIKIFDHRFIPFENVNKIIYINENGKEITRLLNDIWEELKK
jgi:hypothetical protein